MPESLPVDDLLRREVGLLRQRESRRVFDTTLHVGVLAGERASFVVRAQDLPVVDVALRADLVGRLLAGDEGTGGQGGGTTVWVTRAGPPEVHDADLAWLGAARGACLEQGLELAGFYVVTRTGWLDPLTLRSRTWKRLRL